MTSSTCCFCTHLNPARAKFCNECASPMHLKPCRLCDAVNARDAQACHRCEAALPVAPGTAEPSPERIVAEADETLAELKRELTEAPALEAGVSGEPIRSVASDVLADVSAAFDVRAREPLVSAGEGMADVRAPVAPGTTDEQPVPAIDVVQQAFPLPAPVLEEEIAREDRLQQVSPADDGRVAMDDVREAPAPTDPLPTPDTTSVAVHPEDRQWRPERRSRRVAVVIVAALVVLPVAVYVMRNPAQLDEWLGRLEVPSIAEPTPKESSPAVPTLAAPEPAPAPAPVPGPATAGDNAPAPAPLPTDAAAVTQPAQDRAGVTTLLPPSPPVESATPFADEPTSITVTPERDAKSASASRARGSAARARPRERVTKPRPQAPAVQSQRGDGQPAATDQAPRTEPCTEAVAALGLCNR